MDREKRLEALFQDLAPLPAEERRAALDARCGDDPELRKQIESLLTFHDRSGILDEPLDLAAMGLPSSPSADDGDTPEPGDAIGPYRILEVLGSGGMGAVCLAEQSEPVRRRVALKLIKRGMDSREVIGRFESERQALALMDSRHIARILDAGSTEDGRPYFAMEYVDGVPITEYSDRRKLNVRQRLQLFLQVCEGIEHAHQKGIIHRDIKPTNILVTTDGDESVVKVIDFGIAKAVNPEFLDRTRETAHGMILGTPEYMSPEQAGTGGADIDTRTDVYSSGVVLYELLVGDLPYDRAALEKASLAQMQERLRTAQTPKPSQRLADLSDSDSSTNRRTTPAGLKRLLRGDLDWIALRALNKDRSRRYQSISELAADIRRYLGDEPVLASPPSARYRLTKFVRKNRAAVLSLAAVVLALVCSSIASTYFYLREQGARVAAERSARAAIEEARRADAVSDFFRHVLVSAAPENSGGDTLTVFEAIQFAVSQIDTTLLGEPRDRAAIKATIGGTYLEIGDYGNAERQLADAVDLFRTLVDPDVDEFTHCLTMLGQLRSYSDLEEAKKLHFEALELAGRTYGVQHFQVAVIGIKTAYILQKAGEVAAAEELLRESIDILNTVPEEEADPLEVQKARLRALQTLARPLHRRGRYSEALDVLHEALEIARTLPGEPEYFDPTSHYLMGKIYGKMHRYEEAASALTRAYELRTEINGAEHMGTLVAQGWLAVALTALDDVDRAGSLLEQALETCSRNPVCRAGEIFKFWYLKGEHHRLRDDLERARAAYELALEGLLGVLPGDDPWIAAARHGLGQVSRRQRELDVAAEHFRSAVEIRRNRLGTEHPDYLESAYMLADVLIQQQLYAEAGPLAKACYDGRLEAFGPQDAMTRAAVELNVRLFRAWGRPGELDLWQNLLEEVS
ncbi:MAG: tetratricopeptide repeat protein [Candidatus Krumholzibacteriia bacterium]